MRVLFWSELFWPHIGGVEVLGARMVAALSERGHEFVVVTRHDDLGLGEEAIFKGIPVHRLPFFQALAQRNPSALLEMRQRVIQLKRSFTPDLVHLNSVGPSAFFHLDTPHALSVPTLVTFHGHELQAPDSHDTLLRRTMQAASWVTAPSAATMAYVRQLAPDMSLPASIIYNGLEQPSLSPEPLPFAPPRLLYLGRLSAEKGVDLALDALAQIRDRHPQVRFIIAGDGQERNALEEQAVELGLAAAVDFVGWVSPDAVPELLNTATMVLMPSRSEALPLVALQAAMMARPLVGTEVGGLPEVVVHGETGLLVQAEDSQSLAGAIASLLERPDRATLMGQAARKRAREVFGWERFLDAYERLYSDLVAGRAGKS